MSPRYSLCWARRPSFNDPEHILYFFLASLGSSWHVVLQTFLSWGPFGLLILSALDSAGIPVVGAVDTLLVALATRDPKQAYLAAFLAIIGSLAGSLFLFGIAKKGGEVLLMRHVSSGLGARLHNWFQRYGLVTVFVPALSPLPMPMKVPVFCAGALQVRIFYFASVIIVARTIRYFSLAYLGQRYGQDTARFLAAHAWTVIIIAVCLTLSAAIGLRLYQQSRVAHGQPE